jgi:phosphatidylinositol glycan class T
MLLSQRLVALALFWIVVASSAASSSKEAFTEELLVVPLPDGKALTHFQFTTQWQVDASKSNNDFQFFNLFPKSLGQLLHKYQVDELHLTFTQGRWMYERWGYPIHAAPFGVELYAWFKPTVDQASAQMLWRGLTNGLSGLFCASLQFLDDSEMRNNTFGEVRQFRPHGQTAQPFKSFRAEGDFNARDRSSNSIMLYGTLPHEAVCTENLTPWIKLLPCRAEAGFGALLSKPQKLYDVNFHSMGIHFRPICDDKECKSNKLELAQTLSIVMDPLKDTKKRDFSLQSLYNEGFVKACPLASRSTIFVEPSSSNAYSIQLTSPNHELPSIMPWKTIGNKDSKDYIPLQYVTLKPHVDPVDVQLTWKDHSIDYTDLSAQVDILARRYVSGFGQQQGGLVMHFENKNKKDIAVSYYQAVPWFMKLYFHTLKIVQNGAQIDPKNFFSFRRIEPSEDRKSPAIMELEFNLKANTTTFITLDFDKCFLHYTEHPPDANRGFDISGAVMTIHYDRNADAVKKEGIRSLHYNNGLEWSPLLYDRKQLAANIVPKQASLRVYTEGILMSLPTPDFSMPYNVITLTCTVVALYFGSVFNTLERRYRDVFIDNEFVSDRPIFKLLRKIGGLFSRKEKQN